MTPARFGRRYIAFLLDIIFLELLGIFATVPLVNQTDQSLTKVLIRWFAMGKISPETAWLVTLYCLVLGLLWSMYFVGFTAVCGQTPGKRIMGLHVVNENGTSVDWSTASVRFFIGYSVSLLPLGLGFFWALVDKNNQAWHDKIAATLVIEPATS
jgi:uncharacterized RDD family membrane protein YckC